MSKFYLVTCVDRGRVYYKQNSGGWTIHREGAKEYPDMQSADRDMAHHWQSDTQHSTRSESRRAKL